MTMPTRATACARCWRRAAGASAEAANGADALQKVAQAVPDVVLLDLNMPVVDGFDFLSATA